MLRPIDRAARERKPRDGLWDVRTVPVETGPAGHWLHGARSGAQQMPVPAVFGDLSAGPSVPGRPGVGEHFCHLARFAPCPGVALVGGDNKEWRDHR